MYNLAKCLKCENKTGHKTGTCTACRTHQCTVCAKPYVSPKLIPVKKICGSCQIAGHKMKSRAKVYEYL